MQSCFCQNDLGEKDQHTEITRNCQYFLAEKINKDRSADIKLNQPKNKSGKEKDLAQTDADPFMIQAYFSLFIIIDYHSNPSSCNI